MVTIHRCESYQTEALEQALTAAIEDIGGLGPYIKQGETVLLKVNLVMGKGPEQAATTHPAFVAALARRLKAYGCRVIIGDSPGGPFNAAMLRRIYKITGMQQAAEESGAELSLNTNSVQLSGVAGKMLKNLTVTAMSQEADQVISVCKLKTHGMMTYTGAVKNMFGTVPGTMKAEYHVRMPKMDDFADALIDICEAKRPVLSFMDAVMGMEGDGPTSGSPRKIGAVLASASPYELDIVAAGLIGLGEQQVPTLKAAAARGLAPCAVQTKGDAPEEFVVRDFRMPEHIHTDLSQGGFLPKVGMKLLRPKVRFDLAQCVGCGDCAANCPAKVIVMKQRREGEKNHRLRKPVVDYRNCIRCFCCQELCPQSAVHVKESWVFRLANRI
jgi:uncharacterized protein (DUF362 family)/Pyruvate/2-oxoacid:ferredoxin oxidoreductase delta subunit